MAGNIGSPLCAELNRIANNGVYPDRDDFLEEQGAANVWAGTTGQGLLGALNYIVDPSRTENNFSDLTKVCNELAGTTGLSDVDALRTINHAAEVLLRGTTPQSAVFTVDAVDSQIGGGYLYLPGINANYASTPDSAALDITGDLDIRVKVAPNSWTPTTANYVVTKWGAAASQRSYTFGINTNGTLVFQWSNNGTGSTTINSTAETGFAIGETKWIRIAFDVDNGASGNDIRFFTSSDGTTWTQLGTTITTAGVASIFAGTAALEVGAFNIGTLTTLGKIFRAQVLSGIGGTTAFDANFETAMTAQTVTSFTESSANAATVTINRTTYNFQLDILPNLGKAGALLPTTVGSSLAADSNDAKFLAHTGTNYVNLPGVDANLLTTPATSAFDITGDIDIRGRVAMDDWTPANISVILAKNQFNAEVNSYSLAINTDGTLRLNWYDSVGTSFLNNSIATGLADGSVKWVRATLDVDNGASGFDVKFFLSDDGITWTQLGTTQTTAGVTNIRVSTQLIGIGNRPNQATFPLAGKIYRAQLFNGIDGTKVLDVDTSVITTGAATSFTAVTGQTVTINRSTSGRKTVAVTQPTWLFGTDDYMEVNNRYMAHSTSDENYVYLSGSNGNNMSVADTPPLDVVGDIDIQVKVAMDDWTPSAVNDLFGKTGVSSDAYRLRLLTTGVLRFIWTNSSAAATTVDSTVATGITDGVTKWVRVTLDVDNGASGKDVKFFTSDDGTTWTQLGTTVTTAGVTDIRATTANLFIGSYYDGTVPSKGKFYRAIIKNGIDGTTVLDANAAVITLPSQTTFIDSSSNAYTVTINKSGVGTFVSTGNYLYLPGVTSNYASAPDSAALDITGDIDLRAKVALDDWTPSATANLISKNQAGAVSYYLNVQTTGALRLMISLNGTAETLATSSVVNTITDGATKWVRATRVASTGVVQFFTSDDGLSWTQLGTNVSTTSGNIAATTAFLEIGTTGFGGGAGFRGKFFRAQVLNGIGGTVAFDANFEGSITSLNQASFTESSSNAATVTINRSGSAFRSAGVIDAGYLYPGATNTFSNSTTDFLSVDASTNMTVLMFRRKWNTSPNYRLAFSKGGYSTLNYETGNVIYAQLAQTSGSAASFTATWTPGALQYIGFTVNRTLGTLTTITSNGNASPAAISGAVAFHATTPLTIAQNDDAELVAFAVFRNLLTTKNIADIANYFNGRD
jgi:hypothetical protein